MRGTHERCSLFPVREIAIPILMALAFALAGCASAPPPAKETKMVWPPPPLQARIQFVRTITSEKDLTSDTTFSDTLAAFLTGEKLPSGRIAEPTGLAVSDDGNRLYVADLMQQAVFVFDFKNQKFTKLGDVGAPSGIALDANENIYVVDTGRKVVAASTAATASSRTNSPIRRSTTRPASRSTRHAAGSTSSTPDRARPRNRTSRSTTSRDAASARSAVCPAAVSASSATRPTWRWTTRASSTSATR